MIDIVTRLIEFAKRAMPNDSGKELGLLAGLCLEAARELENARREAASWEQQASDRTDDAVRFAQERDALKAKIEAMEKQVPICRAEDLQHAATLVPALGLKPEDKLYALPGAQAQPAPSFADAYQGAMGEVAIWKKRALEAEELNRKFVAEINGPVYMGEPAQPAPSVPDDAVRREYVQPVPDHCDRIVWRGSYYHLPLRRTQPAPNVPDAYFAGIEAVVAMLQKKANDYANANGYDDMGSLSFGRGMEGQSKMDYYNDLIDLAGEVREMLAAAPEIKP